MTSNQPIERAGTMKWDPRNLLKLARRLHDEQVLSDLHRSVSSVRWKLAVAEFHVAEALSAIPKSLPDVPDKRREAAHLALLDMSGSDEAAPFSEAQFISEAHAIAAAQALHSVADIVSNVVYLGLGFGSRGKALPVDRRNLHTVRNAVDESGVAPRVAAALARLSASETFRYLRAYVNTTKHVRLIDRAFGVTVDGVQPERYGLTILPFQYEFRGTVKTWPPKWLEDFLRESLSSVWASAVEIGEALEESIASRVG